MNFPYQKDNGIIKYLYNQTQSKNIIIEASLSSSGYDAKYAFDWTTKYWWAGLSAPINTYISFCFLNYKVRITGYELTTSSGKCRLESWITSVSNDNIIWVKEAPENYQFAPLESQYFSYYPGTFQCMKISLTTYSSTCKGYGTDINQIEIFGTLYNLSPAINAFTCKPKIHLNFSLYVTIFILCIVL